MHFYAFLPNSELIVAFLRQKPFSRHPCRHVLFISSDICHRLFMTFDKMSAISDDINIKRQYGCLLKGFCLRNAAINSRFVKNA